MTASEQVWQDLERPRGLSDNERRLLTRLVAAVDEPLLRRQVDAAAVVAVCRCGCSSVRLHSDEPPIAEERVPKLSDNHRSDYFHVDAFGRGPELASVDVVLHVVEGRVAELEVFAGEGVAVSLSDIIDLTDITVA